MVPGRWLAPGDGIWGYFKEDFFPRGDGWISWGSSVAFLGVDKQDSRQVMKEHEHERTTKALIEHLL